MDCTRPGSPVHGISQARILEWLAYIPSPVDLPGPRIEPGSPALWADSLPTELLGKPCVLSKVIGIKTGKKNTDNPYK